MTARTRTILFLIVLAGLSARAVHYLRAPALWHDEAALVVNVVEKDFGELLGPLAFGEAAPPLFLWLERGVVLTLGDSLGALRLPPFCASSLALVLFAWLASRVCSPGPACLATALLAGSDRFLWHSCEAKPYAVDVLAATGLLALFVALHRHRLAHQLLVYALIGPVVIWLVYPGCFLLGGLLLALLPAVRAAKSRGLWVSYLALAGLVSAAFVALWLGPIRAQRCGPMEACWTGYFPDWQRPWLVPFWLAKGCVDAVDYCFRPIGAVYVLLIGAGVAGWNREQMPLVLLLGPAALAALAALAGGYPFGGARVVVFALPTLALLVGEGGGRALDWLARWPITKLSLFALLATPVLFAGWHVVRPWSRAATDAASALVLAHHRPGQIISGNAWEYDYYFRHRSEYQPRLERALELARCLDREAWLLLNAAEPGMRNTLEAAFLGTRWQVLRRHSFARASVLLVAPIRVAVARTPRIERDRCAVHQATPARSPGLPIPEPSAAADKASWR